MAVVLALLLSGCRSSVPPEAGGELPDLVGGSVTAEPASPAATPETPIVATGTTPSPTALPTVAGPTPLPTPFYTGPLSPACGQLLSAVPIGGDPTTTEMPIDAATRAQLQSAVPAAAWPALARLLDAPGTVGLAAYQLGQPEAGVFLNADTPMPLASVAKLITLVAFTEAVAAGELDALEPVPLADINRFYLPNFDLGAHNRAVNELRSEGRVSGDDNPTVLLEDAAWMMIRHSSNAASDYLHNRLGQTRIEQTVIDLGLTSQSAPCPFLGQFLVMGNHTLGAASDTIALRAYAAGDPAHYGADAALLTDAYSQSEAFRAAEVAWRQQTRRPSIESQRLFSETLNPQASSAEVADLMGRLAQNGLSSPESSFLARRILEWPMQFPVNQELFSNLGYKNGSLPGVLTTAYYAYRWNDAAPVVVVLFYRDLPQQLYRQWRRELPHDELARWLLSDPQAIPLLRNALTP